jgi:CSLREA domain-containing protein
MSRTTSYLLRSLMLLMLAALVASVVAVVLASPPAQAATSTVTTAADELNTNAQCSLREAIINSNQDNQSGSTDCAAGAGEDTINFNLGSTATITLGSQLPAITAISQSSGLIIDGGSADITISGANKYRVFEVFPVELTLSNLTVANGAIATFGEGGGGILNSGTLTVSNSTLSGNSSTGDLADGGGILNSGTLTVSNSTLSGNSAPGGGGIYNEGGTATVSNSTLSNNSASFGGGGIQNNLGGAVTVINSTLSGNSTPRTGGGIANQSGTVTVSNSTLSGNSSASFGGGGILNDGTLEVSNSTLSGNSSVNGGGGGILNFGTLTVSNSTLSGNSAGAEGGGILLSSGTLEVSNSTLSGNSASFGGGIINNNLPGISAKLKNTIVAANDASVLGPDARGAFTSQGHNLIGQCDPSSGGCAFTNGQNGDLVGTPANPIDPMVGPLANNGGPTLTHALLEGSPAIDKGVAVAGITTDQRGAARSQGAAPDIGAFELQAPPTPPDTTPPKVTSTVPANGQEVGPAVNVKATFSEKMDTNTINGTTFKLFKKGSTTQRAAQVSYSASTRTAKLDPTNNLRRGVTYKAVVSTGAKDLAGNRLDQDRSTTALQKKVWYFTVDD